TVSTSGSSGMKSVHENITSRVTVRYSPKIVSNPWHLILMIIGVRRMLWDAMVSRPTSKWKMTQRPSALAHSKAHVPS
ncbi:MAG TPA: hypothetical protein VN974_05305, partial [Candidatus Dormibacteraeota bacterium]|nr:hypothetical protein [Candidatus Dormibacteraeota bacterium]